MRTVILFITSSFLYNIQILTQGEKNGKGKEVRSMVVAVVILAIMILACAVNWLKWKISTLSMIYYMEIKGYRQPSKEEMAACTQEVMKHMRSDLKKSKV